ncbi:hypothetical protein [Dactylosporangium sp. NPDC051541]|uniref:hypothetical protein n=1 Tax=Dactylosporangium sp. NPDC051541 TaxID=3363977 RepID=UPI0037A672A0
MSRTGLASSRSQAPAAGVQLADAAVHGRDRLVRMLRGGQHPAGRPGQVEVVADAVGELLRAGPAGRQLQGRGRRTGPGAQVGHRPPVGARDREGFRVGDRFQGREQVARLGAQQIPGVEHEPVQHPVKFSRARGRW